MDTVGLNKTLELYFSQIKKADGGQYEPNSLCVMQAALDRYLNEKKYGYSILRDTLLEGSQKVLEGKARYLRQELGMGKRPNKSSSLTKDEEETLWDCGQLGPKNPRSLLNTKWFLLTQHFGLRGRQEHYTILVQDFVMHLDEEGNKFYTFAEGVTKTRQSGLREKHRVVIPKMFETKSPRCPVALFELYISKRPTALRNQGPFYLAVIDKPQTNIWYEVTPLGVNSINKIMQNMIKNSPLVASNKKITNHSARKTVVKKLKSFRVQKSDIIGITGHSSEAGLDPYDSGDEVQQREYSHAIDLITMKIHLH